MEANQLAFRLSNFVQNHLVHAISEIDREKILQEWSEHYQKLFGE